MPSKNTVKIKICVGSCCHLKGSNAVIAKIEDYISNHTNINKKLELQYNFCMGECLSGVCVQINKEKYRDVAPDNIEGILDTLLA